MELICTLITTILLVGVIIIFSLLVDNKPTPIEEPKPFEPKPAEPKSIRTTAKSLYSVPSPIYNYGASDTISSEAIVASILIADALSDGETKPYIPSTSYQVDVDDSPRHSYSSSSSSDSSSDSSSSSSSGGCD